MSATGIGPDLAGRAVGGRRLIAVVYADMVGYSRLIGLDDAGTLRRLRTLRRALIDPAIRDHGGRIVQTGGDSLLVAFDSIDGAVRCAVKVQQQVPVYDGDHSPDRRIRFRVGINIGDVIQHDTDLHGDGVNIAARLEAGCPVGGICVSRTVRDHVHGRLDLAFEPIGELTLKNIARRVEAFVVRLDPGAVELSGDDTSVGVVRTEPPKSRARLRPALAGVALLLASLVAATGWWLTRGPPNVSPLPAVTANVEPVPAARPASTEAAATSNPRPASAPQLSVVVLPFDNLGGVDDDTADAIADDLTGELARIPGFFVIGRNSAFTYKGKPIDIKRVGEELGVRYAVRGGVRELGGSLRVTAQLITTDTGAHLWADRFEVRRDGIGYNVDDIVRQIGWTLTRRIVDTDAARSVRERPTNPQVADILLRARSVYNRPTTPERQAELVPLYERALELDPKSVTALTGLAEALLSSSAFSDDARDKIRRAEELLKRAELLGPDMWSVMWTRVFLLGAQNRCQELMPAAQRTVEAHPLSTGPLYWMGICQLQMGRSAEAIENFRQAIRINPRNQFNSSRYRLMGYGFLFLDRYDDAVQWFHRSLAANPGISARNRSSIHAVIAAAHALAGHLEEARSNAAEAIKLDPMQTARSYFPRSSTSPVYIAQVARMRDGMRLAGIRDHADEDADTGVPSDGLLRTNYVAPTPTTAPGARTIRTPDLVRLLELRKPLVLDTLNWGRSIPGAIGLWGAGVGGNVSDEYQDRLARKMQQITDGDRSKPIVAMGFNSERYQGRNLALRLVAAGYTNVYWYRGGREAWQVAGLPDAELVLQDW
jgi:adenylate cyclase